MNHIKKYFSITISLAIFLLSVMAVPLNVSALETAVNELSGGSTIEEAGMFDEKWWGLRLSLKEHLAESKKMFIKLPELYPGQTLKLELFNAPIRIKVQNGVETEVDDPLDDTYGYFVDENLQEYCKIKVSENKMTNSCLLSSLSSEKESYQYYLVIKGGTDFSSSTVSMLHKSFGVKVSLIEHYDSALTETDAPNVIHNAYRIEPGEYTGWVSVYDKNDYYKVEGLSDGAQLTVTLSTEKEMGSSVNEVTLSIYNENKTSIKNFSIKDKENKSTTVSVSVPPPAPGQLPNKTVRYLGMKLNDYSGGQQSNFFYNLSVEATGYESSTTGGGGLNCSGFMDVASSDTRCPAITRVKEEGVMYGKGDGTQFKGLDTLNRAELSAVVLRFIGETPYGNDDLGDLSRFSDVSSADLGKWWVGIMRKAVELNIIRGFSDNTLRPADPVNRAQFFVIVTRSKEVTVSAATQSPAQDVAITSTENSWYRDYVKFALDNNLIDLDQFNRFLPNQAMTRYEVADAIFRWFENLL